MSFKDKLNVEKVSKALDAADTVARTANAVAATSSNKYAGRVAKAASVTVTVTSAIRALLGVFGK